MSAHGHVSSGSSNNGSQYISTTLDPEVAAKWNQPGQTTVTFDTDDVIPDVLGNREIIDISTKEKAIAAGLKQPAINFATSSKEVLIVGHVPADSIHIIDLKTAVTKTSDCPQ
ncbi:hypothetical protein [Gynuella sunshinyii]|uniref:Uncharacterized protein n=1 Tax=Gynuella sunshinyii YC6258 TaxID=1445510 RepID=A0A0C5VPV2_9GAMM|nr:hypothetical protein [Gynuella sunshinyii]AJQ92284.1 hypothetical Protein YC6258_00232 [Gynuella sunshinyii YC6258]